MSDDSILEYVKNMKDVFFKNLKIREFSGYTFYMAKMALTKESFRINKKLLKEAEGLIGNKKLLGKILKIDNPLDPIGPLVAAAVYLVVKKLRKEKDLPIEFLNEVKAFWIPLANNFGMWKMRYFLEDKVFELLAKKDYELIKSLIKSKEKVGRKVFEDVANIVEYYLKKAGLGGFEIVCRQKNVFGIFEKMQRKQKNINHITDFFAFRIVVEKLDDCYVAMKILHNLWPHYPERFKDYIKKPKKNRYQSIHTTLFCLDLNVTEFQIRSLEMDYIAKYGVANHALYKKSME